jgi:hypothetical protein
MQTPVSSSWFAVFRPCGRIAGLLLVAGASAAWQPWAEAQLAPKAAAQPTTQSTTDPDGEPAPSTGELDVNDLLKEPGDEGKPEATFGNPLLQPAVILPAISSHSYRIITGKYLLWHFSTSQTGSIMLKL